jgi:hypothetical protein
VLPLRGRLLRMLLLPEMQREETQMRPLWRRRKSRRHRRVANGRRSDERKLRMTIFLR